MSRLTNLMAALILAFWMGAIALLAVQNITSVSLRFVGLTSIPLAIGLLLAFCFSGGLILGALIPLFQGKPGKRRGNVAFEEDEFDFEEPGPG